MNHIWNSIKTDHKKILGSLLSALIGALCFKYFVFATNIVPAGFSGLALLTNKGIDGLFHVNISLGLLMLLFNLPAFFLAYFGVGKKFSIYSFMNTVVCSLLLDYLPNFQITNDQFLLVIIGGILGGISGGVALRVDTSTGGTDFITLYFAVKKNKDVWNYSLAFNILILSGGLLIYGFDGVAYSIIYQIIYIGVIKMMHIRYNRKILFIFTNRADDIADLLIKNVIRGVTILNSKGAYSKQDNQVLITVVSTPEVETVVRLIRKVDQSAFISVSETEKVYGSFYQLPFE